jgi:hypothetical protein
LQQATSKGADWQNYKRSSTQRRWRCRGRDAKFSDLNMLVVPGGRERTREEFAALLEASGLRLERVLDAGTFSVVEAAPA